MCYLGRLALLSEKVSIINRATSCRGKQGPESKPTDSLIVFWHWVRISFFPSFLENLYLGEKGNCIFPALFIGKFSERGRILGDMNKIFCCH